MTSTPEHPDPNATLGSPARASAAASSPATVREQADVAAPIERVFDALVNPVRLAEWCRATTDTPLTAWRTDVRPGGHWEGTGTDDAGRPVRIAGTYTVVEPVRRLESTWETDDGAPPSVVRFDLERAIVGGSIGTRITVTHTSGVASAAVASASGAWRGWGARFDRLASVVAPPIPSGAPSRSRLLLPSVHRPAVRRPRHARAVVTAGALTP